MESERGEKKNSFFFERPASSSGSGEMLRSAFVRFLSFNLNLSLQFLSLSLRSYNTWQMLEAAAGFKGSPSDVTAQLDKAVEQGLNTVRAFAFGTEEGFALQKKPGQYDEATFKALDFVLDEARKRGLRLVLALANNWPSANTDEKRRSGANSDNKFSYADSIGAIKVVNGRVTGEDAFFTDPRAKQAYKDHLSVLANRVNSINGRKYKGE